MTKIDAATSGNEPGGPERLSRAGETLEAFKVRIQPRLVLDHIDALLEDLFLIRNPAFRFAPSHTVELAEFKRELGGQGTLDEFGEWFYFPWNGVLAHFLPEEMHLEVRTARNRNIITHSEQQKLAGLRVAFAGLSVGSHGVITFALMGGGSVIKIADPDVISPANLNRVRFDFLDIGRKKTDLVREYLWKLNPFANITSFDGGITPENVDDFLSEVDVLVEETDNLGMKILLRLEARKRGIPVVMATDNGDNIIVEVERFDQDKTKQLFNGALGDISLDEFKSFPPQDLPKLATKIAGPDFVTERMMGSLLEVGKTIYSWPQLADAATLSGVAIAYVLKRLALSEKVTEEKREISLDAVLDPDYFAPERVSVRNATRETFFQAIGFTR